jgi:hypothetical protein
MYDPQSILVFGTNGLASLLDLRFAALPLIPSSCVKICHIVLLLYLETYPTATCIVGCLVGASGATDF